MKNQRPKKIINLQSNKQTFQEHLYEFRHRLVLCTFSIVIGSILGFFLQHKLLDILIAPLNQPIFYTSPAGGFEFTIKISLLFGFVVSLPVIIYQIIRFFEPALPSHSPKYVASILVSSTILLVLGMFFAYFISIPAALHFLASFNSAFVKSLISTSEYFSFTTRYLIGFGLIFQLPLILAAINYLHRISVSTLLKYEKWVILVSFILAALLTPTPDIINQSMMAIPIIVLYQITIVVIWAINRHSESN